jgi:hypothetical protein
MSLMKFFRALLPLPMVILLRMINVEVVRMRNDLEGLVMFSVLGFSQIETMDALRQ